MKFYGTNDLKKMGWSKRMIKELAPKSEIEYFNYCGERRFRYRYSKSDIDKIMRTTEFLKAKEKYLRRKAGAVKAYATKIQKLEKQMKEFAETSCIKSLSQQELQYQLKHKYKLSDVDIANKIVVLKILICNFSQYNEGICMMDRKVGKDHVIPLFRNIILRRIGEMYPEYAELCQQYIIPLEDMNKGNGMYED